MSEIKDARIQAGIPTTTEFARLLGVHPMTVRKWETGERKPNEAAKQLVKLLLWLYCKHPEILEGYLHVNHS